MKTKHILYLIAVLILVLSSCREITITTKVNKDGSFTRIVRITGDSSEVLQTDLPFPVNDTWAKTIEKDTSVIGGFVVTYTKSYRNSDELNEEIASDTSWQRSLNREISVTRKFGFFYSYLKFRQVVQAANPFDSLNYKDFLTREDLLWISGMKPVINSADSSRKDEADDKADLYFTQTMAVEIESMLAEGIRRLNIEDLKPEDVSLYHDSIAVILENSKFTLPDIIERYSRWTGRAEVMKMNDLIPPPLEGLDEKMEILLRILLMDEYVQVVEMPGLITATNSIALNGNQVRWQFIPVTVLFEGYEIYVESRVINIWAFVVSGLVILALISIVLKNVFRQSKP